MHELIMKQIKTNLKIYYDKDTMPLRLRKFIEFEMALMVVQYLEENANASKGYIMFTKYQNIQNRYFDKNSYLIQNASICLKIFRSQKIWKDTLKKYERDIYSGIRLFDIENDTIIKRNTTNLSYGNRGDDYMNYILSYSVNKSVVFAKKGDYDYYNKNSKNKISHVMLNENVDTNNANLELNIKPLKPREKIIITISELIEAAEEIQTINPKDYCANILKNNIIKEVNCGKVKLAEKLEIDKVINIVGMVGSGKTTLLKVLSYIFDKKNIQTVIVTDTVAEVFNLYRYFSELKCDCSPLIGKAERVKYINQMIGKEEYYLSQNISQYLTTNCLIDGLDTDNQSSISFGEEPCTKLEKGKKFYVCPYFNQCPTTLMQRKSLQSNIVITTVAGLVLSKVGVSRDIYLKHVIEKADIVFFDECDKVQKNLDGLFAPSIKFGEFIMQSADDCFEFMSKFSTEKERYIEKEYYKELELKSTTFSTCVSSAVKAAKMAGDKTLLSNTFSAYTLLDSIKEDISEELFKEISSLMEYQAENYSELYSIMYQSCNSIKTRYFEQRLEYWLDLHVPDLVLENEKQIKKRDNAESEKEQEQFQKEIKKRNKKRIKIRKKIQLILTLICFDKYIMEIGDAYAEAEDIVFGTNELVNFIRTRFKEQQDYLPSALMGNLFGIKLTQEDDLILFRQYAYGRSLLTDLSYLRINKDGMPLGPHVILLSGSSYAKGSYEYHVNAEVNYIIEADQSARNLISKTKFIEFGFTERVSGSPLEDRDEVLRKVVDKVTPMIIDELYNEGKILLVVNSFVQAELVAERLRANLIKQGCKDEVRSLISDMSNSDEEDERKYIRRGEVYKFDKMNAKILVAPALSIERGHNIVDEHGHSTLSSVFFMIRPMAVPDDIKEKIIKLNGYMAEQIYVYKGTNIYEKNIFVRNKAIHFWQRLHDSSRSRLDNLSDLQIKKDLVATIFVLILQIFGRLCRITDTSKNPPTVYFVDGAFRQSEDVTEGFDTLNEIYLYLQDMLNDRDDGDIAKTLYEPFFTAYEKGIRHE